MAERSALTGQVSSSYDQACRERKILPKFVRAVNDGLSGKELDVSGTSLGDSQFLAILSDESLMPAGSIIRWRLSDMRLTGESVAALSARLIWQTDVLDLSNNDFAAAGSVEPLAAKMEECRLPCLRSLDLSSTGLTCAHLPSLCEGIIQCKSLLRLELNKNFIKEGKTLGLLVGEHETLTRLGLSSNRIDARGMADVFRGLLENSRTCGRLADVDVSWNPIGRACGMLAAEAISAVLSESTILYHLDLSYAGLDAECCAEIGRGLRDNHHLYGLHLVGNAAQMDANGFLEPVRKDSAIAPVSLSGAPQSITEQCVVCTGNSPRDPVKARKRTGGSNRNAKEPEFTDDDVLRVRDVLEQKSTCWACEGWARVELEWKVRPGDPEPRAVWAYTSLDHFASALRLERTLAAEGTRFVASRMVPGGCTMQVLFQVDSDLKIAPGMEPQDLIFPARVQLRACEELPKLQVPSDYELDAPAVFGEQQQIVLKVARAGNFRCPGSGHGDDKATAEQGGGSSGSSAPSKGPPLGRRAVLFDGPDGRPTQMLRVTEAEFRRKLTPPPTLEAVRHKPFYDGFHRDSEEVVQECLDTDWSRAKVSRILNEKKGGGDAEAIKEAFRSQYRGIIALYRLLSTMGDANTSSFGVTQIVLSDFIVSVGLTEGTKTRLADVDRLFIASKVENKELKRGLPSVRCEKALVRHQFLEFLIRLASQRFFGTPEAPTMLEAVNLVLAALRGATDARIAEASEITKLVCTEEVAEVFRQHDAGLHMAYKRFSGTLTPPAFAPYMSPTEFLDLLEQINGFDSEFSRNRGLFAFRLGMTTQAEERYASKFQEMNFEDFQQAIGAVVYFRAGGRTGNLAALADAFFSQHLQLAVQLSPRYHSESAPRLR